MKTFFAIALLLSGLSYANAADVSFDATQSIGTGQTVSIPVIIDTEGEDINALEGTVMLPAGIVVLKEVHEGDSIVGLWTSAPKIEDNGIFLSGVIPGGFSGTGKIATLLVTGTSEGTLPASISFTFFQNDGEGTKLPLVAKQESVTVVASVGANEEIIDTGVPDSLTVEIVETPEAFEGRRVAVFTAHDPESGIAYYEVQEHDSRRPVEGKWQRTESPYYLVASSTKYVSVKAVDYGGQERITTVSVGKKGNAPLYFVLGILGVIIVVYATTKRRPH